MTLIGINDYLVKGNRLEKPKHCDNDFYNMMMQCSEIDRKDRPSFSEISEFLDAHYKVHLFLTVH